MCAYERVSRMRSRTCLRPCVFPSLLNQDEERQLQEYSKEEPSQWRHVWQIQPNKALGESPSFSGFFRKRGAAAVSLGTSAQQRLGQCQPAPRPRNPRQAPFGLPATAAENACPHGWTANWPPTNQHRTATAAGLPQLVLLSFSPGKMQRSLERA